MATSSNFTLDEDNPYTIERRLEEDIAAYQGPHS